MTEQNKLECADPLTAPFWEAAGRHELIIQRCRHCGHHQFYPRPYCLMCQSDSIEWVKAAGSGVIYSMTTVHLEISEEFKPPYVVALVQLDEGPRMLTNIVGDQCQIGDRVQVTWKPRSNAPPLPVFQPA